MSFEDTTRKMADEVAVEIDILRDEMEARARILGGDFTAVYDRLGRLCDVMEKLARCVARRFPGNPDEAP